MGYLMSLALLYTLIYLVWLFEIPWKYTWRELFLCNYARIRLTLVTQPLSVQSSLLESFGNSIIYLF